MALTRLGSIVATPAAMRFLERANTSPMTLITRHASGDWGDLCKEDVQANENAIAYGGRIFSVYKIGDEKLYCITEADHSSTCLLLACEY